MPIVPRRVVGGVDDPVALPVIRLRRWPTMCALAFGAFVLGAGNVGLSACAGLGLDEGPPIALAQVDMDRMYGGWFLIATIPNWFEEGMVEPYDVYSKRGDGDIREDFYLRNGSFEAPLHHFVVHDWVRPGTGNAHWRVQIVWPFDLPFLILYTDPDYRYVMFGEQNRQLGWIYARTPTLPDAVYDTLLERFRLLGYDPTKFVKFVQTPEQIGKPGFLSEGIN